MRVHSIAPNVESIGEVAEYKTKLLTEPLNGNFAKLLVICSGGYKT